MKEQGGGYIVNIASLAGLIHAPMMSAYNATKAGVVAISETLAVELKPHGIDVSVVCPSFFRTGIADNGRASNPTMDAVTHKLVDRASHSADEIADIVFNDVMKKRFRINTHTEGKVAFTLKRVLPFEVYRSLIFKRASGMMR
jgi:short-subunit dehydrogenase